MNKNAETINSAIDEFKNMMLQNREGEQKGIYSICSAHQTVILASMEQAKKDDSILLVESTSNQVDQNGGYTGMTPAMFVEYLHSLAGQTGFPMEKMLLGGDHLGPNAWQNLNAKEAMSHSHELVKQYVIAGYQKIHLDCSMFLADDAGDRSKPLDDAIVAARAAALCKTAEDAWKSLPDGTPAPVYVIGTEVPIPGGAQAHEEHLEVTPAADALKTIEITKRVFLENGLNNAWERVCALVVQPGVEFGDDQVFDYLRENASELSEALDSMPPFVFEAHSTDYQTPECLKNLVEDHFCILKVGPWLTFAYREALFALGDLEKEYLYDHPEKQSHIKECLEEVMLENPKYWQKYYPGSEIEKRLKRKFSYSDRSRYYWPNAKLNQAKEVLFQNLRDQKISPTLLCQYLPLQYRAYRNGAVGLDPEQLVRDHIGDVLNIYSKACGLS